MKPSQELEEWFAERVLRSAAKLMRAVNDEARFEMVGLPLELRRVIHVRAIFELLRMVNENGDHPDESEPHYGAFMEFVFHEYKGFVEMCLRMQHWKPETSAEGPNGTSTLPFRKNSSRN